MTQYLLKAIVLIVLGIITVLIVFIAKYWAPDRTVAELKQWQLPNSEFIGVQGMQAHVVKSDNCHTHQRNAAEKNNLKRLFYCMEHQQACIHGKVGQRLCLNITVS